MCSAETNSGVEKKRIHSAHFVQLKKGTWKDSTLFNSHTQRMKSGWFKICFRISTAVLQSKKPWSDVKATN